jgi:CBS domain containing-hemolysin-like protein
MKSEFPVLGAQGDIFLGMVTLKEVMNLPEYKRQDINVEEIMTPKKNLWNQIEWRIKH